MRSILTCGLAAAAALTATVATAPPAAAAHGQLTVTGLTEADTLVTFKAGTPGVILSEVPVTGLPVGADLQSIDFRPRGGALYGVALAKGDGVVYTIDPTSGVATPVDGAPTLDVSGHVAIDVNPVADALRIVDNTGTNLRLRFSDNRLFVDGDLHNADGRGRPMVTGAAYTFSDNNPATATTLYDIEAKADALATQTPPNAGTVAPVGSVPGNATPGATGFDIATSTVDPSVNWAFLTTASDGVATFVEIDLATGAAAATPLGTVRPVGGSSPVLDIAVRPGQPV